MMSNAWEKNGDIYVLKVCGWIRAFVWWELRYRGVAILGTAQAPINYEGSNKRDLQRLIQRDVNRWLEPTEEGQRQRA